MVDVSRKRIMLVLIDNLVWVLVIGFYIIFGFLHPTMFNVSHLEFIIYSSVPVGFIILAEAIVLLSGNFDLSVGQITGFTAMVSGFLIIRCGLSAPVYVLILLPILVGLACGALNGFLVGKVGLNPFLATLGTYMIFFGGTLEVSSTTIYGFPESYLIFGYEPIPTIFLLIITIIILHLVLSKTRFGISFYATGSDARSSRMLGINTGNMYFYAYLIAGALCGVAGLIYTGYLTAVPPSTADGTVFMAFAGAVLGGISLRGGRGSITNVLGGILLISIFESGLTMLAISTFMRRIFFGVLVVVAILINKYREKIKDRILLPSS